MRSARNIMSIVKLSFPSLATRESRRRKTGTIVDDRQPAIGRDPAHHGGLTVRHRRARMRSSRAVSPTGSKSVPTKAPTRDRSAIWRALAIMVVMLVILGAVHYGMLWRLAMPK